MASHSESRTTDADRRRRPTPPSSRASIADLPLCLLEIIMSFLILKDQISASVVCKSWLQAVKSVQEVKKHPWLMCFPNRGSSFEFRDPFQWKLKTMILPELVNTTACYARDGWLLALRYTTKEMFFFNPFSRHLISLPKYVPEYGMSTSLKFAFSCPPTSDQVVVIALDFLQEGVATISTCHPGATQWTTSNFPTSSKCENELVYAKERFFCYNTRGGHLYSFRPSNRTWVMLNVACPYIQPYLTDKSVFLAEQNGQLFLITCSNQRTVVYVLFFGHWADMTGTTTDGFLKVFVSACNAEVRTHHLPWLKNNVYFSRFGYGRKHCLSYSFDGRRYSQLLEWQDLCPRGSLWIDPPEHFLKDL